jgi:hypothetical protein
MFARVVGGVAIVLGLLVLGMIVKIIMFRR